ncbi:MAG: hypothetical protein KIT11_08475 [Fimbriimonadaceae bacterium]|nr:hypothetical protein [Fimbriimonadaceae bacterium]QYK56388.1 MAG: hypothetical protein KF733_02670 [Fimbriimonadaceae bacterium]
MSNPLLPIRNHRGSLFAALFFLGPCFATAFELRVEVGSRKAPGQWEQVADAAVRDFARQTAALSAGNRAALRRAGQMRTPFFLPTRVVLTEQGRALPPSGGRSREPGDIVPTFDTSGPRAFPTDYRQYLQDVFTAARPAMNATFGKPLKGGVVKIKNYDADIQDRYAVAGGYYVPNAPGGPEVRLPVYNNAVAAAVNYIHSLLLAYWADKQIPYDAYNEGLVRGATIQVARTPGSLPDNPTVDQIDSVLHSLYDVGQFYDLYNQNGLGARRFIAPNLLPTRLPPGGNTGGVFLLRYQMAGTAWAKVLAEYPGFIAEFTRRYFADPDAFNDPARLEALGQAVLNFLTGTTNGTIEGARFERWALRQFILDVEDRAGLKLVTQPVPLVADPGTDDFGVFDIVLNAFRVSTNGDETLLSGRSYPIYWRPDFSRFFVTAQDDVMEVSGAYGSVVPNFPRSSFSGQPYRTTVDLPFLGMVARCQLPAGAYSTATRNEPNTFYGTLTGLPNPGSGSEYVLAVQWTGGQRTSIVAQNFAFGVNIADAGYLRAGKVTVRVLKRTGGNAVEVFSRQVNKTVGELCLELSPPESEVAYVFTRQGRLAMVGWPLEPYRPGPSELLRSAPGQTLAARWNPEVARYSLYPDLGEFRQGLGYWTRAASNQNWTVLGRSVPGMPVSVMLQPGWNQVSAPFDETVTKANVIVTTATDALSTFAEAVNTGIIGPNLFVWEPDTANPDDGAMVETQSFAPGRAVFVRSDLPQGAVLVFFPKSGSAMPRGRETTRSRKPNWEAEVRLEQGSRTFGSVRIGQEFTATDRPDVSLDSELPPSRMRARIGIVNMGLQYRDIRRNGARTSYTLRLEDLRPGVDYRLRLRPIAGGRRLLVADGNVRRLLMPDQVYTFRATESRRHINLVVEGS